MRRLGGRASSAPSKPCSTGSGHEPMAPALCLVLAGGDRQDAALEPRRRAGTVVEPARLHDVASGALPMPTLVHRVLRDLVGDRAEEVLDVLPTPQRRALAVAMLLDHPGPAGVEPDVVSVAFTNALRALSVDAPLLLAVDDAQWVDATSRAALAFAFRRLAERRRSACWPPTC